MPPVTHRATDEPAPLSYPQSRMWLVDRLTPGRPTYNVPTAIRLRGTLVVPALAGALTALVRRHEPLRTAIEQHGEVPLQRVVSMAAIGGIPLPVTVLGSGADGDQLLPMALRHAVIEGRRPFDLSRAPLVRARLFQLGETDHLLVIALHHIASDGWSATVLLRELTEFYAAEAGHREPRLAELPVTYTDFARWQREVLSGAALDEHLAYWLAELGDEPPLVEFPADRPRPQVQDPAGGLLQQTLPPDLTAALRALGRQERGTMYMVLAAGLHALLHRYTGLPRIITGFPIANRDQPELENLVGCFINTLVLHSDCSADPSFRELLRQVRDKSLAGYAHQDLPFERLVEEMRVPRDTSRTPLFQVVLTVQNATETAGLRMPGVEVELVDLDTGTTRFDVSLVVREDPDVIRLSWEYATALFDRDTAGRVADHLANLLRSAVADPDLRLSRLAMLSRAELTELSTGGNPDGGPRPACLHTLFEAQADRTPDAVAVTFEESRLTYRELDQRADRLATRLRERGVGPEVLVGLSVRRGLDLVTGLLGILKAGGAYVPFDPAYPRERLEFMVRDTGAEVVVTQPDLAGSLPVPADRLLFVSEVDTLADRRPAGVSPGNLAYVIYTSGSTGQPKGVMIEHRNATGFVDAMIRHMAVTPRDRIVQFSSLNYDVSVFEVFTALLSGACLCLASTETLLDREAFTELMRRRQVTIADLPPAVLATLDPVDLPDLRLLFVGGEAFSGELVNRWRTPSRRFINGYGPTEVTVAPVLHDCDRTYRQSPPIGKPITGHRGYVRDAHGSLTPVGVAGELYLGGTGVARGYLNQPSLTALRFLPDPFAGDQGERLYRTGDLVRYLPGGVIDFLGRVDDQIQLRGIRIEPGEIESLLERHPEVAMAAVVLREDTGRRLVAYVVPAGTHAPEMTELRELLVARMPRVMVPSNIVLVPELPLTPSGKVDRAALPAPQDGADTPFVAPRSDVEALLADTIFAEVLGLDQVGVTDNFFELGGNSLQATQIVARMRDHFNVDVPLQTVFDRPTVAGLAEMAAAATSPAASTEAVDVNADDLSDEDVEALLTTMLADREDREG
jgi:amino acid adenylation domain-containing protein